MGTRAFMIWVVLAIVLGVIAGLQESNDLAEAFSIFSTFAAGGAFASLISVLRLKAHPAQRRPLVEDRLHDLELRMGSAETKLSEADSVKNFDRRLREGL